MLRWIQVTIEWMNEWMNGTINEWMRWMVDHLNAWSRVRMNMASTRTRGKRRRAEEECNCQWERERGRERDGEMAVVCPRGDLLPCWGCDNKSPCSLSILVTVNSAPVQAMQCTYSSVKWKKKKKKKKVTRCMRPMRTVTLYWMQSESICSSSSIGTGRRAE